MEQVKIVLNVTYTMKPGQRENFLAAVAAEGLQRAVQGERGCRQYEYFTAVADPDKLLLRERWQDQDCVDDHGRGAPMARLKQLKEEYVAQTQIDRYFL